MKWREKGWAVWVPNRIRPAILQRGRRHDDWTWPLSKIPRALNAWITDAPYRKIAGTERVEDNLDIPEPGKWVLAWPGGALGAIYLAVLALLVWSVGLWSLLVLPWMSYFAFTTRKGRHGRIGTRKDYVDGYYTTPAVTLKKFQK